MHYKYTAWFFALVVALQITACGQRIDGSSLDHFANSLKAISKELPPEERKQFNDDFTTIMSLKKLNLGQISAELDGKSAKEVHELALAVTDEWRASEKIKDLARIKDLEKLSLESDSEKAVATAVDIKASDIVANKVVNTDNPENKFAEFKIELIIDITNRTKFPIAKFGYVLESVDIDKNGSVIGQPTADYSYDLESPLNPGEKIQILVKNKPNRVEEKIIKGQRQMTFLPDKLVEYIERNYKGSEMVLKTTAHVKNVVGVDGKSYSVRPTFEGYGPDELVKLRNKYGIQSS